MDISDGLEEYFQQIKHLNSKSFSIKRCLQAISEGLPNLSIREINIKVSHFHQLLLVEKFTFMFRRYNKHQFFYQMSCLGKTLLFLPKEINIFCNLFRFHSFHLFLCPLLLGNPPLATFLDIKHITVKMISSKIKF